jgi:hypothetical protein
LRQYRTRSRTVAIGPRALIVGIRRGFDQAANAVRAAAFFRRGTGRTTAHADVAATHAIDAIIGQTLRCGRAIYTIVILAHVFPVTRAHRAIVIGVGVIRDGATNSVRTAAFFGRATRHALVVAFAVTTKAIDAITARTLTIQGTCDCAQRWRDRHCLVE